MGRGWWLWSVVGLAVFSAGCRCSPVMPCYADFIDDVSDNPELFDKWYCPRLDISRAGKPDWCGPLNSRLAPCRCDCVETWDRADECWLYPAGYPYVYPSRTMPLMTGIAPADSMPVQPPVESAPAVPPVYEEAPANLPPAPPPLPAP